MGQRSNIPDETLHRIIGLHWDYKPLPRINENTGQARYYIGRKDEQGRTRTPDGICYHTAQGFKAGMYPTFMAGPQSAHFAVMMDGSVQCFIDERDTAFAIGSDADSWNISVEHEDYAKPEDSTRTPELYESSAKLTALESLKWSFPIEYRPKGDYPGQTTHKAYNANGARTCPGGLDYMRIINRAKEIEADFWKQLANEGIPSWKKNLLDVGNRTFKIQKQIELKNIETGASTNNIYEEGKEITVRYANDNYYLTESSVSGNRPTGFLIADLEYVKPKPLMIYSVSVNGEDATLFDNREQTEEYFLGLQKILDPGTTLEIFVTDKSTNIKTRLDYFIVPKPVEPVPDPENPEEPTKPQPEKKGVLKSILELLKKVLEFLHLIKS